jgi:beta-glucosidase
MAGLASLAWLLLVTPAVVSQSLGPPKCSWKALSGIAFGVGSSAPQIEGGYASDGRSPSVWDVYANPKNGKISDGSTPWVATDFFNKYKEDIALMKSLGVKNLRLSFSWSRIIPEGVNGSKVNEKGVQFYNNVLDELKTAGIEPAVTLFHWDVPQVLQDKYSGFIDRRIVDDFVYYADVAFSRFGSKVTKWTTFNEPWITCNLQYGNGDFAPGISYGDSGKWKCGHHLLLAHAFAVKKYKDNYQKKQGGKIGMALWTEWSEPWRQDQAGDRRAAANKMAIDVGWFADTIHFGDYPEQVKQTQSQFLPTFSDYEKSVLKKSYDYMGMTIYTAKWARENENPNGWWIMTTDVNGKPPGEQAQSYWLYNAPWSIYKMLTYIKNRYDNPFIWVLENGISEKGEAQRTGDAALQDPLRTQYFHGYISETCRAFDEGVRVTHYFAWSFTDNWEWKEGFSTRFGVVRVDFDKPGLPRRVKDSGKWLSKHVFTKSNQQKHN